MLGAVALSVLCTACSGGPGDSTGTGDDTASLVQPDIRVEGGSQLFEVPTTSTVDAPVLSAATAVVPDATTSPTSVLIRMPESVDSVDSEAATSIAAAVEAMPESIDSVATAVPTASAAVQPAESLVTATTSGSEDADNAVERAEPSAEVAQAQVGQAPTVASNPFAPLQAATEGDDALVVAMVTDSDQPVPGQASTEASQASASRLVTESDVVTTDSSIDEEQPAAAESAVEPTESVEASVVTAEPEAEPVVVEATADTAEPEEAMSETEVFLAELEATADSDGDGAGGTGTLADGRKFSDFSTIKAQGLSNACYLDDDHYEAEFLYQNPDVCLWEVEGERVVEIPVPTPPANAVRLPAPSGVDDTDMLESIINANANGAVIGSGTYRVNGLSINVPVDIFSMPMRPTSNAGVAVTINSADVRIFDSPIDAHGSSVTYTGFDVRDDADRFMLVRSGFSNIHHKNHKNASGVMIRGADDFHIACNTFENIINDTNQFKTARANAIWMVGAHRESTAGGVIANNYAREHQSNGKLKDGEFFTIQGYTHTSESKPVRIFANRTYDAGKRLTKIQEDNALILSNYYEWKTKFGPLGSRTLLSHVEIQFSDNVIARNNRVNVFAKSRFDYIFNTNKNHGTGPQDNIHYDCNDIKINDRLDPDSGNIPKLFVARATIASKTSTGLEATNSTANNNRVHGNGSVRIHYYFGDGYQDDGGRFEHKGNVIEVDAINSEYQKD